ncbi:MAG: hypothetical protein HFI93_05790 [Lachnospiraceae bacterium]|nr:hypothetical protein [Lachnospiraceae bacterium]
MSSKTKIFVFKMKELIYTAIFLALGILLILLLITMFRSGKSTQTAAGADNAQVSYIPGVYSASIVLGNQNLEVAVSVDSEHINSIRFVNLDESVAAMYPLMESSLNTLSEQILAAQSTKDLTLPEGAVYTSTVLVDAVDRALEKAAAD